MRLRFVLVGHPVAHSLSPIIHRAAYRALGLPHEYELVDCPDERAVREVVESLRLGDLGGANVTLPWKRLALELADDVDPLARQTGAANVLVRGASGVVAHNTDVLALSEELSRLAPLARRALVIGAGGAALAAVSALVSRGAARIVVLARRFQAHEPRELWPGAERLVSLGAELCAWPVADPAASARLAEHAATTDVVIQATSAGMSGGEEGSDLAQIVPWERLPASALAYDVVYTPAVTPFLARAKATGLTAQGGLGMLVGQAAQAMRLWLDVEPPLLEMTRAAEEALAAREGNS